MKAVWPARSKPGLKSLRLLAESSPERRWSHSQKHSKDAPAGPVLLATAGCKGWALGSLRLCRVSPPPPTLLSDREAGSARTKAMLMSAQKDKLRKVRGLKKDAQGKETKVKVMIY